MKDLAECVQITLLAKTCVETWNTEYANAYDIQHFCDKNLKKKAFQAQILIPGKSLQRFWDG